MSSPQSGSVAHALWLEERIADLEKALNAERERSDEQAKVLGQLITNWREQEVALSKQVEISEGLAEAVKRLAEEGFPSNPAKRYPGQPGYGQEPAS